MNANVLFRIHTQAVREDDLDRVDTFHNSVLHIATTLGSPPNYLAWLISMGADVHKLNNGNQTFLHLIHPPDIESLREFRILLGSLVRRGFNFEQQDHNGQTTLHALTQWSIPWKILSEILQSFQCYGIDLPKCRDNLGHTVAEQLREKGFKLQWPFNDDYSSSAAHDDPHLKQQKSAITSYVDGIHTFSRSFPFVQSLEDLRQYELNAELLRTIVQAGDDPSFEDTKGRNGLHCLAKVRLDLPTSDDHSDRDPTSPAEFSMTRCERYLEQLLVAGVNPNSHDKRGITPLMAFIMHSREGEDDALTTRLLSRLFSSGADINRRNLQGETSLHIAVKLGRRAATKFLLSHGANVHARTSNGQGVLSLGFKHNNRAANSDILYAQISLCICLVANAGAVSNPTILNEWASPDFRIPFDRASPTRLEQRDMQALRKHSL